MIKTSVSHNYRFPTLNDLYFLPGGNSSLKNDYKLDGSATWFNSYIED